MPPAGERGHVVKCPLFGVCGGWEILGRKKAVKSGNRPCTFLKLPVNLKSLMLRDFYISEGLSPTIRKGFMIKKEIIIVDDEPLIPVLMKEIVEEDGLFTVARIAGGKKEFLEAVQEGLFDIALIDMSLEGREGGLELLELMKNKGSGLPVVILSAYDELQYALTALKAGARGYINKKYICSDVVPCLHQVLEGRLFVSGDRGEKVIKEYEKLYAPSI